MLFCLSFLISCVLNNIMIAKYLFQDNLMFLNWQKILKHAPRLELLKRQWTLSISAVNTICLPGFHGLRNMNFCHILTSSNKKPEHCTRAIIQGFILIKWLLFQFIDFGTKMNSNPKNDSLYHFVWDEMRWVDPLFIHLNQRPNHRKLTSVRIGEAILHTTTKSM